MKIYLRNCGKQFFCAILILALMVTCGDKKKQYEDLHQAFELHKEAINIRNQVADQLTKLDEDKDSLFVEAYKTDLDAISLSLKTWDEQLMEVPGFEEVHDHSGHDHDHKHDLEPEMTPAQHLELQLHLLQEIQTIEERINQIKN